MSLLTLANRVAFIKQVYAQCDTIGESNSGDGLNLGDCLKLNSGQTVSDVYKTPADLINVIVPNLFVVAGVLLFLMIVYAGFKFSMSGGSKGKEDSKDIIKSALIGFMVMFSAYWIIQIIQVVTGVTIF